MTVSRKIPPDELPDEWSSWASARFQSREGRDGFLHAVTQLPETEWGAEAMVGDVRGARVRWRRGWFLRLNDLAYSHGGRIVVG
ncbi:MAG TPA: hypothetical protein VFV75_01365 [Candidatus Polarisedimenticolaceae bacterium]|nr:hypothetical protein [Candidatus Polarisedimenticolaceae bacterium]